MDSLKSLMDRKEYDLVLRLTKNTTDINEIFYRISAFLATGKYDDALNCLMNNRSILQQDLPLLMKVHIELLCILGKFDDAYGAIHYYENLPYQSQQAEELLKELPNYIRLEEKKRFKVNVLDEEELIAKLRSDDQNDVLMALDCVRSRDIGPYLPAIGKIIINFPKQSVRSFALLLLVEKKIDKIFQFKHIDKNIDVNPSQLEPPFVGEDFNNLVREISREMNNPSLSDNAIQIFSSYIIYMYPEKINEGNELIIAALYLVANEYLQSKDSKTADVLAKEKGLDLQKLLLLEEKIKTALDNF